MSREKGKRMAGNPPQKKHRSHQKKKSRLSRQQKILVTIAVILALTVMGVFAWKSIFVRPELGIDSGIAGEKIDFGDGVQPKADGKRKAKDWYTILLLGRDTGGGGNCDTMMLASYNVTNQEVTVLNIPRDTMVNVPWDVKKINSVYNVNGKGEKGIQALYKEISQLVGFTPDFQVIVEWEAVGKLVDAIGGVWFDVPRNMDYDDPLQDLSIHIQKGYQCLNGKEAMGVVRFRDGRNGYKNGDIGRIETQQNFLKAVMEQLLKIQNVTKIKELAKVFEENVSTDLSYQNLFWLGKSAVLGGLKMEDVDFVTMPFENTSAWSRSYHANLSYVTPKGEELLELVNTQLSPFVEEFTMSDLDIMSVNADGSIRSSTGYVEDTKATSRPAGTSQKPSQNDIKDNEIHTDQGDLLVKPDGSVTVLPEGPQEGSGETPAPPSGGETVPETPPEVTPPPVPETPPSGGAEPPVEPTPPPVPPTPPSPPPAGGESIPAPDAAV